MSLRTVVAAASLAGLAGCATMADTDPATPADSCRPDAGKRFVGQRATAELGAEMLRATGAQEIRWVPPDTAVTMEYKFGRLTVGYDRDMLVTSVSCV